MGIEKALEILNASDEEIMDIDCGDSEIRTEEDRQRMMEQMAGSFCSDVRLATGRVYTTQEFEERRKKVYETPLP